MFYNQSKNQRTKIKTQNKKQKQKQKQNKTKQKNKTKTKTCKKAHTPKGHYGITLLGFSMSLSGIRSCYYDRN